MEKETLAQTVERLTAAGYTEDYRAEREGLRAVKAGCVHAPEDLFIEEVARFEGASDPDEQAAVFALRCVHGARGTWTVAYGPAIDPLDAEMAQRLRDRRPERQSLEPSSPT
ncbi:MAG: hypothetical protein EYC70_08615 [Planctomycetota bacterium]|nr:MAG: hypothetical protein EYC70_08615 [Planctomycetota bacterium]